MTAVYQISLVDGSIIRKFDSAREIMKTFNRCKTAICDAMNGRQKPLLDTYGVKQKIILILNLKNIQIISKRKYYVWKRIYNLI